MSAVQVLKRIHILEVVAHNDQKENAMKLYVWYILLVFTTQITFGQKSNTSELSDFIGRLYVEGKIHGGVLIANSEDIIYKDAWGIAKKEDHTSLNGNELFSINSMGKMFTSILILQLVDEGIISLDDNLNDLLKDFKHPEASEITLHDLLAHRSGIRDYFLLQLNGEMPFDISKEEMLIEVANMDLKFKPGTKFNYSNTGYILLSLIVEKYREKNFYEVMEERIFNVLEMKNTFPKSELDSNQVSDYFKSDGSIDKLIGDDFGGDGGEISTLEDMHKFMSALGSVELLSPQMWTLAFTPHSFPKEVPEDAWPPPHQDPYGYGFSIMELPYDNTNSAKAVAHGGAGMGSSFAIRYIDSERIIINWNNMFKNPILIDLINFLAVN
ncbi:serine hydrolase domain-containing protein [Flagellimonas marina]|uniref:Serine hydrolase domain-containing protein n=1 Tax=Flagellimonas marina TaxID=1775168 RepID=A0ABV8PHU7_9FLAO